MIGLSGLITPSLDEMVHVAKRDGARGFHDPAPDRRRDDQRQAHGREDRPGYHGPVVHVKDASRSVGVVDRLSRPESRAELDRENRAMQAKERKSFAVRRERKLVSYDEARRRRFAIDWAGDRDRRPGVPGHARAPRFPARRRSSRYIDWSPFFMTWELKGKYPAILDDPDGRRTRHATSSTRPRPCCSNWSASTRSGPTASTASSRPTPTATTSIVYTDESRTQRAVPLPLPPPAVGAAGADRLSQPGRLRGAASARAAPITWRLRRHRGLRHRELVAAFKADHDDYNAIMAKALADRLAEAFAELLHQRARRDWGYGRDERSVDGRPDRREVPRHPPGGGLSRLPRPHREGTALEPARRRESHRHPADRKLRDVPGRSVSGLYFAHPQARYFAVDLITKDQVEDYAARKAMPFPWPNAGWRRTWLTNRPEPSVPARFGATIAAGRTLVACSLSTMPIRGKPGFS